MSNATGQVSDIDVTQARAALAEGVPLIDVREDDEWQSGHVPGAIHLPLSSVSPAAVPADGPVMLICRAGGRSSRAAHALADAGLQTRNVVGGMNEWAASGGAMVAENGQQPTVI